MYRPDINTSDNRESLGIAHLAISVGSEQRVDYLTEQIRSAGFEVSGEPRTTGDGYYESVVRDPEGNRIEITT
jgi:lactoylglutathione lyase